jgi:hypothetical protein
MSVQALTQVDPTQFFNLNQPSANGTAPQRLDTKVSGVAISNDFSGRLSVTTAEGDTITLSANVESDFLAASYKSHVEGDGTTTDVAASYARYSLKQEFGVTVDGDLNEQEVRDLTKLFRKVANIFEKYLNGQDDAALAKTAKLVERFGRLSSLSGLDLNVDVDRSVTALAARIVTEVTGQPTLPTSQQPQTSATTSQAVTPGGAPAAGAVIPHPPTGTTAPTPPSTVVPVANATDVTHLSAPAQATQQPRSLAQQILEALKETNVDSRKVQKYLPDFLQKLREDLGKELRGEREHDHNHDQPATEAQTPATTSSSVAFAYQAVSHTSISLSIRS